MAVPTIRFDGFEGDWEEKQFYNEFSILKNNTLSREHLSYESWPVKNIHYGDILVTFNEIVNASETDIPTIIDKNDITDEEDKDYQIRLKNGDIILADTAEDYTVGKVIELQNVNTTVVSGLHTIPFRSKTEYAKGFLGYYLNSTQYHDQLRPWCVGTKVMSLNKYWLSKSILKKPSFPEQQKIGSFFAALNQLISLQDKKVANLKKLKKGLMQKIFSRQIRFKADDGSEYPEWEEKKLGDVCNYSKKTTISSIVNYVGTDNMLKGCAGVIFSEQTEPVKGVQYHVGDVLLSNIRPYLQKAWLSDKEGVCSSDVLVLVCKTDIIPDYLYTIISNSAFFDYVMTGAKGLKMPRGDKSHIMDYDLLLPCISEQQKIAAFLSSTDNLIQVAEKNLAQLKEIKKGLMQKMFV